MQKAEYVFAVDHLISNQAVIGYPLPVPDTQVFGQFDTRYPGIKIGGYLQSLALRLKCWYFFLIQFLKLRFKNLGEYLKNSGISMTRMLCQTRIEAHEDIQSIML